MRRKVQTEKQRQKTEELLRLAEERMELLDTIKEMMETELERRVSRMYRTEQGKTAAGEKMQREVRDPSCYPECPPAGKKSKCCSWWENLLS